ncbi:peptidase M20, partial [Kipferlia bialata]
DTRPLLIFDSHTDTVGVEGMVVEPFGAEIRDGKMYGRGTCDTKGTGAAMLCALKKYAERAEQPVRVAVMFSVDEEVSMDGIKHFLNKDYEGIKGDAPSVSVIVGEPTDLRPYVAHNGVLRWKLVTSGVAAHSSRPFNGRSAITPMLTLLQVVESEYIPSVTASHDLIGRAACAVTMLKGGHSPNVIADHCEALIDRRLSPGHASETVAKATEALKEVLDGTGLPYSLSTLMSVPSFSQTHNAELTERVSASLEVSRGEGAGVPTGINFCTHASWFSTHGVPCVVLGPGLSDKAHTKDEYICLDRLEQGVEVYLALMNDLC